MSIKKLVNQCMDQAGFYDLVFKQKNTLYFVVGDVHGMGNAMQTMIDKMKAHAREKRCDYNIIFLGDLIDRGDDFERVVDILNSDERISCLMGNHEMCFIEERYGVREPKSKARNVNHGKYDELEPHRKEYILSTFESFPYIKVLLSGDTVFILTHAPVHRSLVDKFVRDWYSTMKEVSAFDLCVNRGCELPLNIHTDRRFEFYHGHIAQYYVEIEDQLENQYKQNAKMINVDSGCVFGNYLLGLCLNDKTIFKVT